MGGNERARIRMNSRESWNGTAGDRKGFLQRLFGLLHSFYAFIMKALQRKIWMQEEGLEIDDLEDLTARIGDPHTDDLIKIYTRPLQYFTSFSRNGGSNSEAIPFQIGGMTMPAQELDEIFRIETIEGN
jgi:hypothetical protein